MESSVKQMTLKRLWRRLPSACVSRIVPSCHFGAFWPIIGSSSCCLLKSSLRFQTNHSISRSGAQQMLFVFPRANRTLATLFQASPWPRLGIFVNGLQNNMMDVVINTFCVSCQMSERWSLGNLIWSWVCTKAYSKRLIFIFSLFFF